MSDSPLAPPVPSPDVPPEPSPSPLAPPTIAPTIISAMLVAAIIFFVTLSIGWVGTANDPSLGEQLLSAFEKDVAGQIIGNSSIEVFAKLFFNNFEACIFLFLGGASLGILTIFILSLNGIVIGSILEIVSKDHTPLFVAAAIVPHGIFEIPAFIISCALGLLLAQSLIGEWFQTQDAAETGKKLGRYFVLYVLPLVLIAAYVEAFITPVVIQLVS